jgi:DNA-binding NtrC family response regulator
MLTHYLALVGRSRESLQRIKLALRDPEVRPLDQAKYLWFAGIALYRAGHYSWAKKYYLSSAAHLRILRQEKLLSQVLVNLALVAKNEGGMATALAYFDEAAAILPRGRYTEVWVRLLINRGVCLYKVGQISGARTSFLEAHSLLSRTSDSIHRAMIDNNLGHIYRAQGNLAVAEEHYRSALHLSENRGLPRQESLSLEFLGEILTEQGRHVEALAALNRALTIAKDLGTRGDLVMEILRRRGEAHLLAGATSDGLRDLDECIQLCVARGEARERALAERASCIARKMPLDQFEIRIREVLDAIQRTGDRFEFARTICLIIEDARLPLAKHSWLRESAATAIHYLVQMGNRAWSDRVQSALYSQDATIPRASLGEAGPRHTTNSSLYAQALSGARLAARSDQPALVLGETGSGKEVISLLIHQQSARKDKPFVAINCGALPENLFESELFGHVRGAFTGAERDKSGLLEMADGGTAFLDEVADLPPHTQVKLLRFLDCGELRRLGDTKVRKLDTRIIAATNKNLHDLVGRGRFREDLFYRLNVFQVDVPPLRLRREDIWPLAQEFLVRESHSRLPIHVSDELKKWMLEYDWPGNVRELLNLCRYLSTHAWGKPEIAMADLPPNLRSTSTTRTDGGTTFEREKAEFERAQILKALQETGGNISAAARLLGAGRNRLARRIRDLSIAKEDLRL